jgi:hypothetical protein
VTPSDDLSPPRRPIFFPVVIATVFLTIIGGTFGFMLGERHRDDGGTPSAGRTTGTQGYTQPSSAEPTRLACPKEAIQFAAENQLPTDLTQIFKIITTKGTTVWICQDGAGSLYFQSKTGGVDKPLVQGKNALFLSTVSQVGENEYEAVATVDGNRFDVNRRQLVVHFTNGNADDVQTVKSVE